MSGLAVQKGVKGVEICRDRVFFFYFVSVWLVFFCLWMIWCPRKVGSIQNSFTVDCIAIIFIVIILTESPHGVELDRPVTPVDVS